MQRLGYDSVLPSLDLCVWPGSLSSAFVSNEWPIIPFNVKACFGLSFNLLPSRLLDCIDNLDQKDVWQMRIMRLRSSGMIPGKLLPFAAWCRPGFTSVVRALVIHRSVTDSCGLIIYPILFHALYSCAIYSFF